MITNLINEIKDNIRTSEEYILTKEAEKKMLNDASTFILLNKYQNKQKEYNDALRFKEYSYNIDKLRKELADIKYLVDTNEFVIEYTKCYKRLEKMLTEASSLILKDIK